MAKIINSSRNRHIKDALQLRGRRGRTKQGRMLVDGARELLRAVQNRIDFVEVFVCSDLCDNEAGHHVIEALSNAKTNIFEVTADVFGRIAYGQRTEGIVGVANTPRRQLSDLSLPPNPLVLVLEAIEKPGNIGAVIRSADGAGASAVIVADAHTDLYNPNAIRASLGTIFTLPVYEAISEDTLAWLRLNKITICAAFVDAGRNYVEQSYREPTALVLGSEASGLSSRWKSDGVTPIRLPMCGSADSLNVSATAAVLLYEALRQRRS